MKSWRNRKMKQLFLTALILALLIAMTACGVNTDSQAPTESFPDVDGNTDSQAPTESLPDIDGNTDSQAPIETYPDIDGNPYTTHKVIDGKTYISYDYSEVYDSLDLSQYTSWGSFGVEGLMWVKKSDYTGVQFGYIDYKGNVVIPFSSEIVAPGDFEAGYAIVSYELDSMGNGVRGVIDTNGVLKFKYNNHARSECYRSSNGNIVFVGIHLMNDPTYLPSKNYLFCGKSGNTIEIPGGPVGFDGMYYSDGLLRTYGYQINNGVKHIVTFYDENGEVALIVDSDSSPHFKDLTFVDDFVDGEAIITFVGQDREYYRVKIDKKGEWIGEPWQIDRDDLGNDVF